MIQTLMQTSAGSLVMSLVFLEQALLNNLQGEKARSVLSLPNYTPVTEAVIMRQNILAY